MWPDNYRPVSLLPILSKILERIIFVRLMAFFDKNCIINCRLFGFQNEKSTVLGTALDIVKSFLQNSKQAVDMSQNQGKQLSELQDIKHGLPQDDTSSITVRPSLQEARCKSNQTVEMITHWLEVNRLILNYGKTNAIIFRNNKRKTNVLTNLQEPDVRVVESAKFLGITVDSCLGWKDHFSNISNKRSSAVFAPRQIKSLITVDDVPMVYFSYFNAIMSYGKEIWGHSTEAIKIFKLQNREQLE
ncbi:uncharacterized protein LOC124721939 [Schistocerca piceifrons]|uniref:uncharacterized protein LOC124721939 n=1 Tax=Schistocerca piceifrons TaxID=274613 RepID=UPI001F5FADD9|nr:uncharacterized protein LOC124721939 [Schistocerca piceifrons]